MTKKILRIILIGLLTFQVLPFNLKQAQACLDGYSYRKPITLSPVTPEANYQVKVTLTSVTLTDAQLTSGNANGNDIRFTGSDATTLQDYWIESWSATGTTVTATIWVEVATSGSSTIYMYYGNSTAASASNGANTFDFFDDFSGTSLDLTKWTLTGTATVSGGTVTTTGTSVFRSINTFLSNVQLVSRFSASAAYANLGFIVNTTGSIGGNSAEAQIGIQASDTAWYTDFCAGSGIAQYGEGASTTAYYIYKMIRNSTVSASILQGSYTRTESTTFPSSSTNLYIIIGYPQTTDWVFVSKYTSSEPGATAGSEEASSTWSCWGDFFPLFE